MRRRILGPVSDGLILARPSCRWEKLRCILTNRARTTEDATKSVGPPPGRIL